MPQRISGLVSLTKGCYSKARLKSTIADLQAAFRDPNSPFYVPPGGKGPAFPDEIPEPSLENIQHEAMQIGDVHDILLKAGFDSLSFWEQKIAWGDQDSFQHVNNARYVQFFESSRIKWVSSVGKELGGWQKAEDMLRGRGVSLILKSIEVRFRRPVTYPDTLIIGYRPLIPSPKTEAHIDPAVLPVTARAYSIAQKAFVASSNEVLVWYDYDGLRKCDPGDRVREIINGRIRKSSTSQQRQ